MLLLYQKLRCQSPIETCHPASVQEFWTSWLQSLENILLPHTPGVLLSSHPECLANFPGIDRWIFSRAGLVGSHLHHTFQLVPLEEEAGEQWCLLCCPEFQVILVSSAIEQNGLFTFHPSPIGNILEFLIGQIREQAHQEKLLNQLRGFPLQLPGYAVLAALMNHFLSHGAPIELPIPEMQDIDILQAMMHEVRTPLTTIRTLLLALLKRHDLSVPVHERLAQIERESREQIDRFNFLFQVVEQSQPVILADLSLEELLETQLAHWQWQSARRQLELEYEVPHTELPAIISNAPLLMQLLNGLMDRMMRSLSPESRILIQTSVTGEYLKLEFSVYPRHPQETLMVRAIGRWLLLQPETGTLSLSLPVTKALFQSLGGKLTIRVHPPLYEMETLTIFLPRSVG